MNFLYSFLKTERNLINVYRPAKEQFFQHNMVGNLESTVEFDYQNFKQYLQKDCVVNILNNKYNFTDILPRSEFGNLSLKVFRQFMKSCLADFIACVDKSELTAIY